MKTILLAVILAGCSKVLTNRTDALYVSTTTDVTATAMPADLQAGRTAFVNSCGKCHSYYSPDNYSAANWKVIISIMATSAGLSATETSQAIKYITRRK